MMAGSETRALCADGAMAGEELAGRRILVTGATGRIGRQLVPWLASRGAHVVVSGRDPVRLAALPGAAEVCASAALEGRLDKRDIDSVIDLAVLNSDAAADPHAFRVVNLERVQSLIDQAGAAGVRRVIVMSSYHAADPDNSSHYAATKRELERWIASDAPILARVVVMPKIAPNATGAAHLAWRGIATARAAAPFAEAAKAIETAILAPDGPCDEATWVASMGHHAGYDLVSRIIDVAFALAGLIALSWLMLILAIAVRLDSPGPAIFRQQRVGRREGMFTLYKFRTMALGTKEVGTHEVTAASVTRMGRFLRRSKLDELPQAWNILRGELALVGPRPCLPVQHQLVAERRAHGVFALRPGLTGLAQVNGIDMSDPRELVRWEVLYMRIRGILLDLRIIWQTFAGRGGGDRTSS